MAVTLFDLLFPVESGVAFDAPMTSVPMPTGPVSLDLKLAEPVEVVFNGVTLEESSVSPLFFYPGWVPPSVPGVYRWDCLTWSCGGDRGEMVYEQDIQWQYVGEGGDVKSRLDDYLAAAKKIRDQGWKPDLKGYDRHAQKVAWKALEWLHPDGDLAPQMLAKRVFVTLVEDAQVTIGSVPVTADLSNTIERRFVERCWMGMSPRSINEA